MADYIDREELENKIFKLINPEFPDVMQTIYSQPSVDAVEVVRCKDCKHRSKAKPYFCMKFSKIDTEEYHFCTSEDIISFPLWVDNTDFCKWGDKNE